MGDVADCTAIELNIENITGVTDADDNFIRSAQKFVVASIPKNLLKWAITETVPATHGGDNDPQQVTLPVRTDNIISVRRDSYAAKEVPAEERGFIDNTSSLKKATNIFPKYYIADGNRVIAKPDPDSTYKIYVMYIDYTKVNDDSDLRNAVVYHACASEFTKLAVYSAPTVGGTADELTDITALDTENTIDDFDGNSIEVDQWFATAAHLIEGEEDVELAQAQLGKISTYINAYGAELQKVNAKAAHNLQMADKYYQWANLEIRQYIENNSKTEIRRAATNQVATAGR